MQHHACNSRDDSRHIVCATSHDGVVRKRSRGAEMSDIIDSATSRTADGSVEPAAQRTATDNRAEIAREIATTKDTQTLKKLVERYIRDATRNVAIPGDRLPSIEKAVVALRPRDTKLSGLVRGEGSHLKQLWQAQGRSHEVWDKLAPLIRKRDWAGVKAEVANELATLAKTSTTVEAIQNYRDNTLLACGPKQPDFRKAVESAVSEIGRASSRAKR